MHLTLPFQTPMPPNETTKATTSSHQQMMTNQPLQGLYYTMGSSSNQEAAAPSSYSETTTALMATLGTGLPSYEQQSQFYQSSSAASTPAVAGNTTPEYFKADLLLSVPVPAVGMGGTASVVAREMDFLLQPPYQQNGGTNTQIYTMDDDMYRLS